MGDLVHYSRISTEQAFCITVGYSLDMESFWIFWRSFVFDCQSLATSLLKEGDDLLGEEVRIEINYILTPSNISGG